MSRPPLSGAMAFLFTDIEGSTAKWEADFEAMARALEVHDAICDETVRASDGVVVKTTGDGCLAAFARPASAVQAALTIRRRLAEEDWPPSVAPLRSRMAVHVGVAEKRDGDYFGPTLNRAARIMGAGHGGQVLVSEATRQLVLDEPFHLDDLGEHRLRDLLRPEHLYQVGDPGEHHPPLRTLDADRHNLPSQVTPFIGRERELEALMELVPTSPLTTLTGPGGTGKTRLALQAVAELADSFERITFVPLASVRSPDSVASTIADALGLRVMPTDDPSAILAAHLSSRRDLLVLDNFEQLASAAPLIGSLVASAPDLRIVVTSRELLHLRAERSYPVAPLDVPPSTEGRPVAELVRFEAMRLFEARAKAVLPDFALDASNVEAVADICRRLDGLPLAIELAAARIRLFNPAALRRGLEVGLDALGRGPVDAPRRQQTLIDTVQWSYDLLDTAERSTFDRLAVFVGGCALEAMRAVVLHDVELDPVTAAEALADKSLVRVEADTGHDRPRVQMLETIRSFARSKLEAADALDDMLHRHAAHFAELSERAEPELRGRGQEAWMRALDEERPNIQAALTWSLERGDAAFGLRMVAGLRDYWFYQGRLREMGRWADEARSRLDGREPHLKAGVLLTAGIHAYAVYRDEAADLLSRAVQLFEGAGDEAHHALALMFRAAALEHVTGDMEPVRRDLGRAIALTGADDAMNLAATGLTIWGELERAHGNYDRARRLQEDSLTIARKTGEMRRVAMVVNNLGLIAHHLGDDEAADRMIRESLRLAFDIGFEACAAHSLIALAEQVALRGDPERGARLIGAADAYFERIGLMVQPGDAPDFDRIRAWIRDQLGRDSYETAAVEGGTLSLEQAGQLALSG
jgi:predicted ATPase/class 3 adenylate cyclase